MKVGDMVKWTPESLAPHHLEGVGLVLEIAGALGPDGEGGWVSVWFPDETKPRWRAYSNLEVVSESR